MTKKLLLAAALPLCSGLLPADGFDREKFKNPENVFSPGYFWMWNDRLDVAKLNAQLDDMVAHGVRSVCMHPFPKNFRPGIFTSEMSPDYLTAEYMTVVSNVVDHIAELGMNAWLYDEGGWPSGGACGLVAESDKEGRFRYMFYGREKPTDPGPNRFWKRDYGQGRSNMPSVIEPGATERFIELTHEAYKRYIGHHFGKTVKFTFMDEPDIPYDGWAKRNLGWASDFADEFRKRKGYDIMPHIDRLVELRGTCTEGIIRPRLDYNDVLGELYVERFHEKIRNWCRENGLKSGGHMNGEDVPEMIRSYGQCGMMRCLRSLDIPGVDVIWRQLYPSSYIHPGSQPPFPRYASSVANQSGGKLALSESLGIYGNSLEPGYMKWLADYQMVRGINLFVFGYYSVSNRGQWMMLFEPHSGPVTPWWDFIKPYFEYITRTAALLTSGEAVTDTLVYYDDRAFLTGGVDTEIAGQLHYAVAKTLDRMNCEYDFAEDEALAKAEVRDGKIIVGKMAYSTLVLPTRKRMSGKAKSVVEAFRRSGGKVLGPDALEEVKPVCSIVHRHSAVFRVAKRAKGGQKLYFIVNESPWPLKDVVIGFEEAGNVVRADPESGKFLSVKLENGKVVRDFAPFGSALFIVGDALADGCEAEECPFDFDPETHIAVNDGWTLQPLVRHRAGEDDFVIERLEEEPRPVALGDWRKTLGLDFCGRAVYRVTFDCDEERERWLDLGQVNWCCSAKFNGKELETKFFGPFRWQVKTLKGRNTIEVTVANMLCNALTDEVRIRISRKYPQNYGYEMRHGTFDRENNASGLLGPVTLR